MQPFHKIIRPGVTEYGSLYIRISTQQKEKGLCLSIVGVEGPKSDGDAKGSCGQCTDALHRISSYAEGWNQEMALELKKVWEDWHLNDMKAACTHQEDSGWDWEKKITIQSYFTGPAFDALEKKIMSGAISSMEEYNQAIQKRAHVTRIQELSGKCLKDVKAEADALLAEGFLRHEPTWDWANKTATARWTSFAMHEDGLLGKPCPECGYKYGHAWLFREVPEDVLQWLFSLPDTDRPCPWKNL